MKYWKRKGLFYYATLNVYTNNALRGTVTKKLDFVSYHLIRLIHEQEKLENIALSSYFKDVFGGK